MKSGRKSYSANWTKKVQGRLLLLLFGFVGLFLLGLFLIWRETNRQVKVALDQQVEENQKFFEKIVELSGRSLYVFSYDYSYWDEFVRFVEEGDTAWGIENIDASMSTYTADLAWVYRPDYSQIYFCCADGNEKLQHVPLPDNWGKLLFQSSPFAHFFTMVDGDLLEIQGASIHPSADKERKTPAMGYFFVGRFWRDEYIQNLSELIGGKLSIERIDGQSITQSNGYDAEGNVFCYRELRDWSNQKIANLHSHIFSPQVKQFAHTTNLILSLSAILSLVLIAFIAWALAHWIASPLRKISASLVQENLSPIQKLQTESTEFGHIAALISQSFRQKAELIQEIGEREKAEKKLLFTQFAVDHAAISILWIESDGRISYVNENTCRSLGYTLEELLQLTVFDVSPFFTHDKWLYHWNFTKERISHTFECQQRNKDGRIVPIEATVNYQEFEGKEYNLVFVRDITERKLAEEEREKLEAQLRQAQKIESIGRLASGVAHDFNNLLVPVMGYAEIAMIGLDEHEPRSGHLRQILAAAKRAKDLVRQLLAFGRKQVLDITIVQLNEVIMDFQKMLKRLITEDIEVVTHLDPKLGTIKADLSQIHQILMNLSINARDAMTNGGRITIETANVYLDDAYVSTHQGSKKGNFVMLIVKDSGSGMDAETLVHLFEPFFTTKEPGKGTGLGAATVYGLVKQHGGHIWVESEVGKGTVIKIYFPRADEVAEKTEQPVENGFVRGGKETILLVEDDDMVRNLLRDALQSSGYNVLDAENPLTAIQLAKEHEGPIQMLLSDVIMPQMNGKELQETISLLYPKMKILFVSGHPFDVIAPHNVLQSGINFLQKPFTTTVLTKKVREILDA